MSSAEIAVRVLVIAYYVYLFDNGKTDRFMRTQIFAWVLVHFVSIIFTALTVTSLLKSEVTDYKTYYRLKL